MAFGGADRRTVARGSTVRDHFYIRRVRQPFLVDDAHAFAPRVREPRLRLTARADAGLGTNTYPPSRCREIVVCPSMRPLPLLASPVRMIVRMPGEGQTVIFPYPPECMEGQFSEARMQDPAWNGLDVLPGTFSRRLQDSRIVTIRCGAVGTCASSHADVTGAVDPGRRASSHGVRNYHVSSPLDEQRRTRGSSTCP
jgi:hypothetical protein